MSLDTLISTYFNQPISYNTPNISKPNKTTATPKRPVSPEWQKQCKRNGAATITVFVVAALAWLTGSHTLISLGNGAFTHLSWLGWPFYVCLAGIVAGVYVYWAADHEYLKILGRKYVPIDHSAKYSLTFNHLQPTYWLTSLP